MLDGFTWLGLTWDAWLTLCVMAGIVVALVRELASPDQAMLAGLVVLLVAGVLSPARALEGFANPAMLSVGSLFVVAEAVRKTGALAFLRRLMQPQGPSPARALSRIMLPASFLSSFLNNTPIVAILAPLVQRWSREARIPASKLLLPLSHATILGGMCTLVGTSTNLVVSGLLSRVPLGTGGGTEPELGMFELAWVGVPACLAGFLYYALGGHRLLPAREQETPVSRQELRSYQFELGVRKDSPLAYRSVEKAGLRNLKGAFLAHIQRRGEILGPVAPSEVLEPGDVLTFIGSSRVMERLLHTGGLTRVIDPLQDGPGAPAPGGASGLPLFEAVLAAESSLVGRTLRDVGFRERFQAVVLGIHRGARRIETPLGTTPFQAGDLLLLEARPHFESRWAASGEFYLVAPLERAGLPEVRKARRVLAILLGMVLAVACGWLPMVCAALAAAVLVVAAGALSPAEARKAVDLSVLLVIAAAFGLGQALEATGLAQAAAHQIARAASVLGPAGVLAAVYLAANVLTEVITNNVAAVLVFPVGLAAAREIGADPRAFAVAVAIGASASFATPIGYQTNLMVMGPGGYRFGDYVRAGLPLDLLVMGVAVGTIYQVWL